MQIKISEQITSLKAFNYSIEDTFVDKIKDCFKSIKAINSILTRFNPTFKNIKLHIEIEYSKIMISMIIPILNSLLMRDKIENYKKKIKSYRENFKDIFESLKKKFNKVKSKYFNDEEKYLFLRNFEILLKTTNFHMTKLGLTFIRYLLYYIQKLENKVNEIYIKNFNLDSDEIMKYSYKNAHIKNVSQVIHYYLFPTRECLFNYTSHHERWETILKNTEIKITTSFKVGKMFSNLTYFTTNLTYALFYKLNIDKFNKFNPVDNLRMIFYSLYYMFNPKLSKHLRKTFSINPKMEIIERVFSVMETNIVNFFYRFTLNSIELNNSKYLNIIRDEDSLLYDFKDIKDNLINYMKIRVLSNKKLSYNFKNNEIASSFRLEKTLKNYLGLSLKKCHETLKTYNLIIHLHGGGFFSQSSESHLGYLINFSNALDCVVLSIDYTVAPRSKFPNIFVDNFKAYKKIVLNCEKLFGFRINKLALAGDSCGGHFCLDIVKNCIKSKIRKPDGLLLIYPSTRIVFDNMGPSFSMSCRDSFIEISLLGNMQRAVLDLENFTLDDYEKEENLNFYLTNHKIIKEFPRTYLIVATNDPMKDESFILADFLLQNNVSVKIKEFLFYCHGFMNMTGVVPFMKEGENECIKCINDIFNN